MITHCLSFDVEEHFQVSAFASPMRRRQWDTYESRVERNVDHILSILAERSVKATFFVLGWVAERHPQLIKSLMASGHEVASHGYGHQLITTQTPELFRSDVRKAKQILEDLVGVPVLGYRAPTFTITRQTQWALPILVEEGYVYDSSIFPIRHDCYGIAGANPRCHPIMTAAGTLWEIPPSTFEFSWLRIPVAGGGYFRLFPYPILRWMLKQIEAEGRPLVMYLHPWELDPDQPRMNGPLTSRARHYVNLDKTEARLKRLVSEFKFFALQQLFKVVAGQSNGRNEKGPLDATV